MASDQSLPSCSGCCELVFELCSDWHEWKDDARMERCLIHSVEEGDKHLSNACSLLSTASGLGHSNLDGALARIGVGVNSTSQVQVSKVNASALCSRCQLYMGHLLVMRDAQ